MSVTNLELFVFLYCCRSAHSALHKRNTQPILMQFKITVLPQQLNSKILQTQLHNGTRKAKLQRKDLKFRDRTAKPKDHVTQETMKYIKIISIWRERHDSMNYIVDIYGQRISIRIFNIFVYIIDQVRGQDGWILAKFSFCVFMDRDEVESIKT